MSKNRIKKHLGNLGFDLTSLTSGSGGDLLNTVASVATGIATGLVSSLSPDLKRTLQSLQTESSLVPLTEVLMNGQTINSSHPSFPSQLKGARINPNIQIKVTGSSGNYQFFITLKNQMVTLFDSIANQAAQVSGASQLSSISSLISQPFDPSQNLFPEVQGIGKLYIYKTGGADLVLYLIVGSIALLGAAALIHLKK